MAWQYDAQDLQLAFNGGAPVLADIPDFGRGAAYIDDAEIQAVTRVLRERSLARYAAPQSAVERFEGKLAKLLDCPHALACSSGTAGMRIALAALGVRPGEEILVPAIAAPALVDAVIAQGAVPVFVDVDESFTMDPVDAESKITLGTRGLIAVHAFGIAADIDRLLELVQRCSLVIVEDTGQALGASYQGKMLGSRAYASVYSFGPDTNITSGEGGAVTLLDTRNYERAVRFHDHGGLGSTRRGPRLMTGTRPAFLGENLRLSELQGAVLDVQIDKLPAILQKMARVRADLIAELRRLGIEPAYDSARAEFAQSVLIQAKTRAARDLAMRALQAEGVPAELMFEGRAAYDAEHILHGKTINYTSALGCATCGTDVPRYSRGMCPNAERALATSLSIPVGPKYSSNDVSAIAKGIQRVLRYVERQS